jgi:nucleotide-binding universal stress UspA family protein
VDFAETSLRAARLAIEIAAPAATIYLVHVVPRDGALYDWKTWSAAYEQDAGKALRKTREQLRVPDDMTMPKVLLQGDPTTELLAFATNVNADLIATGSHGYGFVARFLVGSVTTRLVRCATCSVLTVPHASVMTHVRTAVAHSEPTALSSEHWTTQLAEFTHRNAGRRGTLEIDDPELDGQAQLFDYPLQGAAYDPHDERVELMFGDDIAGGRHLTRAISGVTSIMVMRDEMHRDLAMRIAHGAGLTLLTFTS